MNKFAQFKVHIQTCKGKDIINKQKLDVFEKFLYKFGPQKDKITARLFHFCLSYHACDATGHLNSS